MPAKTRTEVTSARVARIAGKILAATEIYDLELIFQRKGFTETITVLPRDILALAASALTQTAPKWPALPVKAAPKVRRRKVRK